MLEYSYQNSTKDSGSQWKSYLELDIKISDIADNSINDSLFEKRLEDNCILNNISDSGKKYSKTVCGSFSKGIEYLIKSYSMLEQDIYWKNSLKFDASLLANIISSDMTFLSDQLNWKDDEIELLRSAFENYYSLTNSYENADKALQKLLEIDKLKPENYYIHYKIGMIYLFSPSCLDIEKAEFFFRKCIHNSMSKHSSLAIQLTKHTLPSSIDILNINDLVRYYTAEAYYKYSILNYIKGEFDKGLKNAAKAFTINPDLHNSLYLQAKIFAVQNKIQEAISIFNKLSDINPIYAVKSVFDHDFCSKSRILDYFDKIRNVNVSMVLNLLVLLKKKKVKNSVTNQYIVKIEKSLEQDNSFLSSYRALRLVKDKRIWVIKDYVIDTTSKPIVLQAHKSPVSSLCFHPYLNMLVSGSWDSSIIEWNLKNQKIIKHYRGFRGEITCAAYSSSGKYIIAVTSEGHAKLIDSSESIVIKDWDFGKCIISSACFSRDDKTIYFGCSDKQIRIIDRKSDSVSSIRTSDSVTVMEHLNMSEGIVWGESSGAVHYNNFDSNTKLVFKEHNATITALSLNSIDSKIVSASEDKIAVIWDLETEKAVTKIKSTGIKFHDIDFSPNDTLFAAACSDNFTRLYNLSGREIGKYSGHKISVEAVKMQKTGNVLATAGYDKNVKLWGKFIVQNTFNVSLRDIVSVEIKNAKNLEAYESNITRIKEKTASCLLIEGKEYFENAREEEKKQNKRFGTKDYKKAYNLYVKAYEAGVTDAEDKIKELKSKL